MSNVAPTRPDLSFRARKILYAVVTEYIASGEPVGSRKLAKRYGINLSPATIRNVLSDLEEMNYLVQPHTSAGRVPTDLGFRVFVDALVQMREVSAEDRAAVLNRLKDLQSGGSELVRETGRLLSAMTGAAAVVTTPRPERERLARVRFVPLSDDQCLAVLVTRSGSVQNRVVRCKSKLEPSELERLHNYLETLVDGHTLLEVRQALASQMATERDHVDQLRLRAREILDATVEGTATRADVVIEGQGRLFERPEFSDVEKLRRFLKAFEDKESLLDLIDRTLAANGVTVLIGSEANFVDVDDISLISANYGAGTLGIIGPTRMDYAKCVPLVGFAAQVMGELLDDGEEEEDNGES